VELLLLHPGGLGDVILSLPAVALLREKFPAGRITMAGNTDYLVPVVRRYVDKVVSLSALPLHGIYAGAVLPDSELRFWKSFDQIISWTGSDDPGFVQRLKTICPTALIGAWRPVLNDSRHVSRLFIDSLGKEMASGRKAARAAICVNRQEAAQGTRWLADQGWNAKDPLVVLHPGAGSKSKRWPLPRFISLARHLIRAEGKRLLVVEGPAEEGLARGVKQALNEDGTMVAESLALSLLASVLLKSEFFIGNDSGIAHMAAALGIPVVVLFGATLPQHWAPLGPDVRILRKAENCTGCVSNSNVHTCLEDIGMEDVIRVLPVGHSGGAISPPGSRNP
jgi:hypothetical protein